MKPKPIGIIGGAGPLAGTFLLERIFSLSGEVYGCYRDEDFPQVFLISFPFTEMLTGNVDTSKLKKQLRKVLGQLRRNGASVLAIACNTLHAFLDEKDDLEDLIHLPRTLGEEIPVADLPLVLCTSASAKLKLHQRFLPCSYPDPQTQTRVDQIIDLILKGSDKKMIIRKLEKLIQEQRVNTVIFGCTELSIFSAQVSIPNKLILDPLEVAARKIVKESFSRKK